MADVNQEPSGGDLLPLGTSASLDNVLQEFSKLLRAAGPRAMVESLATEITARNRSQAENVRLFVGSELKRVLSEVQLAVEQEYISDLRADFLAGIE